MSRLSVNLNKVALLRNSRHTGVPDILKFAAIAREAGADGVTIHPRPDARHIRPDDVTSLANFLQPWRPAFELNVEGYPDERLFQLIEAVRPEQCTLVPDASEAFTSEEGWALGNEDMPIIDSAVGRLKRHGCRVILFINPDPTVVPRVPGSGADGVEIYTGSYAASVREGRSESHLAAIGETTRIAAELGLTVNIGHDLNLINLTALAPFLPLIAEASIGHELTADALVMGFGPAIAAYKEALAPD